MKPQPFAETKIEDGFDRQNLSLILKRFKSVNNDRLDRMRGALAHRHQLFLDILPLLFHCNHPMLPGFVSRNTPCKIASYKPQRFEIDVAKTVARSFTLHYEPEINEEIFGIYVMGSVGTIAQSERSDLDIWICHKPGVNKERLELLQAKCERIQDWTKGQRLDVYFFLMDYEAFKQGQLSSLDKESSGSAQRLLLLDEFYRSSIFIAGKIPLWWYVPAKDEGNYQEHAKTLIEKRFIAPQHVLDFGGIANIPEGEFIGAGIWQLYKAIESPYKSVLKLLLLEIYVSEYPNIQALGLQFKQKIFDGEFNIDDLDSYVLMYRRIEHYLLKGKQQKRLELARRCFYFKVNRALSRSSVRGTRPWQRELLKQLTSEWKWSSEGIKFLDSRQQWKVATVASERALLVNELNFSYKFLLEFAQEQSANRAISAEELTVLGRKLQAAFERRPGKVEWINPNISKDLSEDVLSIVHEHSAFDRSDMWTAYAVDGPASANKNSAIRTSHNLIELLLWCFYNGIIEPHTYLELSAAPGVRADEVKKILSIFAQWLPNPKKGAAHEYFFSAAKPTGVLLLVNVGKSTSPELRFDGLQRLSENSDALRYGGHEENLIASIDFISKNSWQEVHMRRFEKNSALLDALEEYLQLAIPSAHYKAPELQIECIGRDHSATISHRLQALFKEVSHCFFGQQGSHRRYLFQVADHYICLQFIGRRPNITEYRNKAHLLSSLSKAQKQYSGVTVDSHCLSDTPIPLIADRMRRNTISVFYQHLDIGMETYIADEKGSISHNVIQGLRSENPLQALHRFLRAIINRQARSQPELLSDFGICPIYFFELRRRPGSTLGVRQTPISQSAAYTSKFDLKATAYTDDEQRIRFDFSCDGLEFSGSALGERLYLDVAKFVIDRRDTHAHYPIYLTDLDLSLAERNMSEEGRLQVTHYLKVKNQLEEKLSAAIDQLTSL